MILQTWWLMKQMRVILPLVIISLFMVLQTNDTAQGQLVPISTYTTGVILGFADSYSDNSDSIITVNDKDMAGSSSVSIHVWSYTDGQGIWVNLPETPPGSGSFQGTVHFSTTIQSNGNTLLVSLGDKVTAEYTDPHSTIGTPLALDIYTHISRTPQSPRGGPPTTNSSAINTISTDKKSYSVGDTIIISGQVNNYSPGVPVAIEILDPQGNLVVPAQASINTDGRYSASVHGGTEGLIKIAGTYTVRAYYGTNAIPAETNFDFMNIPPSPPQDFSLSATSVIIKQGDIGTSTITISPINGFNSPITFSLSRTPSGIVTSFTPNPATTSSELTLTVDSSVPTGTYTLMITGSGPTSSSPKIATLSLQVTAPSSTPPPSPNSNDNPSTSTIIEIGGGIAAAAGGIFIAIKVSAVKALSAASKSALSSSTQSPSQQPIDHQDEIHTPIPHIVMEGNID